MFHRSPAPTWHHLPRCLPSPSNNGRCTSGRAPTATSLVKQASAKVISSSKESLTCHPGQHLHSRTSLRHHIRLCILRNPNLPSNGSEAMQSPRTRHLNLLRLLSNASQLTLLLHLRSLSTTSLLPRRNHNRRHRHHSRPCNTCSPSNRSRRNAKCHKSSTCHHNTCHSNTCKW